MVGRYAHDAEWPTLCDALIFQQMQGGVIRQLMPISKGCCTGLKLLRIVEHGLFEPVRITFLLQRSNCSRYGIGGCRPTRNGRNPTQASIVLREDRPQKCIMLHFVSFMFASGVLRSDNRSVDGKCPPNPPALCRTRNYLSATMK